LEEEHQQLKDTFSSELENKINNVCKNFRIELDLLRLIKETIEKEIKFSKSCKDQLLFYFRINENFLSSVSKQAVKLTARSNHYRLKLSN
jgi:hypothetical protein